MFEDETVMWRQALPRAGWWMKKKRARLPQVEKNGIKKAEKEKREAWNKQQSWSVVKTGVLMYVIASVVYGTNELIYSIVAHFGAREYLQYLNNLLIRLGKQGKEIVLVHDGSGIHKAEKIKKFLEKNKGRIREFKLPAHSGHRLNVMEGFWKVLKDRVNARKSYEDLHLLRDQTRQVLTQHRETPIFHFSWALYSA